MACDECYWETAPGKRIEPAPAKDRWSNWKPLGHGVVCEVQNPPPTPMSCHECFRETAPPNLDLSNEY